MLRWRLLRATITIFYFIAASLFPLASHSEESACDSKASLAMHEGHYARKTVWEKLPALRNWNRANQFKGWVSAIDIKPDGESSASFRWHEGGNVCAKFRADVLWAKDSTSSLAEWEGPFLRVGSSSQSPEVLYFNRLFGTRCFVASRGENWCFGPGTIKINERLYQARLVLDSVEMPTYGSPVSIDREKNFWVFVPHGQGWKVFQDTFVTEEGHKDIDPAMSKPWMVLAPK